eukprot:1124338-Pelagomonas_calceolata.AAC.14
MLHTMLHSKPELWHHVSHVTLHAALKAWALSPCHTQNLSFVIMPHVKGSARGSALGCIWVHPACVKNKNFMKLYTQTPKL